MVGIAQSPSMMVNADEWLDSCGGLPADAATPLLVTGAPRSGKSRFAFAALMRALAQYGPSGAVMAVSDRRIADGLADEAIRQLGATTQARPVTTLSAIAFRIIADARARDGEPLPKLLNGAEQDAVLRQVIAAHIAHVRAGDPCDTCALLREYFALDDWTGVMTGGVDDDAADGAERSNDASNSTRTAARGGVATGGITGGINDAFIAQLRDMLARMDELGASQQIEPQLLTILGAGEWSAHVERLHAQWRLAFTLRREYQHAVSVAYPGEYRLDSSRLLVEGAEVLRDAGDTASLPQMIVIDDCQDLTLAGLSFVQALQHANVRLILVGNPDEAVQTFRGSYPEYLFAQLRNRLGVSEHELPAPYSAVSDAITYRDLIASRVSLSIHSPIDDDRPVAQRPGKLPQVAGSLPVTALDAAHPLLSDNSVRTALYRSPKDELEDVVWRIKRAHLVDGRAWNDMAVIAHDNTTVRTFGERLRRDGVPVRYSSVTRPLKDEPFVQGLFALLELAELRERDLSTIDLSVNELAALVRSRVTTLMESPLIAIGADRNHEGRPARLAPVETAMNALASLAAVVRPAQANAADDAVGDTAASSVCAQTSLAQLVEHWQSWNTAFRDAHAGNIEVDNTLMASDFAQADSAKSTASGVLPDISTHESQAFTLNAMYLLLEFGTTLDSVTSTDSVDNIANADNASKAANTEAVILSSNAAALGGTDAVLASIQSVCGRNPHATAFAHLWNLVARVAKGLKELPSREPQYALGLAWDTCHVAGRWQREALNNSDAGRAANDRLDAAMRLFDYAAGSAAKRDLTGFMRQVRAMRIEADSLAKVAPIDQAVTLTTPAGASGRSWPLVWMPAVQQDVWPNLAARNTLFGGEELADVMLFGKLAGESTTGRDMRFESVLFSEQKSLLVALTRASEQVTISAVHNDDTTPSDFLYGYMPERFTRDGARTYVEVGADDQFSGLDSDPRGLVAAARVALASNPPDSPAAHDAVAALRLLAAHGVEVADPANWPFLMSKHHENVGDDSTHTAKVVKPVTLSPSAVDGIWACPVCWLMENRFAGPRAGSVATSFGSLIHEVAQLASEEGLDLPTWRPELTDTAARIDAVRDRMMVIYRERRGDGVVIDDPADRYAAAQRDATAENVLGMIANYFIMSNMATYPAGNAKNFSIGVLESAQCERSFSALFNLDDVLAAYNAIGGIEPISRAELSAIMGTLVGAWPQGMSDDLTIRLAGRIDRMETRRMADGSQSIRLIDYKTGKTPSPIAVFNDLQLVCYQLGLAFPEGGPRGVAALTTLPQIAQSALFHVANNDAPAKSYGQESVYQPALFANGSLNAAGFTPRYYYKELGKLTDIPQLDSNPPQGVSSQAWQQFLGLRGTQAVWALTMIARVFYAAAASRSAMLETHPQPAHRRFCRMKASCPACAGQIDTVFEVRQA
nr:PD-(D/E)XK nuclease family protein [Bifidobacterium goeldii]